MNGLNFEIEPRCKFFEAFRSIIEYELRPGNTVTYLSEVDLSEVEMIRARFAAAGLRKPTYTAFVVKATALALREFPYANRRVAWCWFPLPHKRLQRFHTIDISVACERWDLGDIMATFADVIRAADKMSMSDVTEWLHTLAGATLKNNRQWRDFHGIISKLPHWLSTLLIRLPVFFPSLWCKYRGGAVLISSPAKYGVDVVAATWSSPLGVSFGLVKPRPVVRNGEIIARTTFTLTLNFDRRVMAGAQAAKFFKRLTGVLENAMTEMAAFLPDQCRNKQKTQSSAANEKTRENHITHV